RTREGPSFPEWDGRRRPGRDPRSAMAARGQTGGGGCQRGSSTGGGGCRQVNVLLGRPGGGRVGGGMPGSSRVLDRGGQAPLAGTNRANGKTIWRSQERRAAAIDPTGSGRIVTG